MALSSSSLLLRAAASTRGATFKNLWKQSTGLAFRSTSAAQDDPHTGGDGGVPVVTATDREESLLNV